MEIYQCPNCHTKFLASELTTFKCSENYVGPEMTDICPKCARKRKGQRFFRLEKIDDFATSTPNDADAPMSQPMAVKHDYREIKCGDMTYEIDLEEVKERLAKNIERALGCSFLENGART